MTSESYHIPVMVQEVLDNLNVTAGGLYIDCTLGGGGHSRAILEKGGNVIGIDRDRDAIQYALKKISGFQSRFSTHVAKFSAIASIAAEHTGFVDGVLMDLGVSSKMIDDPSKGFSYRGNGPLHMSMGCSDTSAYDVVNKTPVDELSNIIKSFGEERKARSIARSIARARSIHPIETTAELSDIIESAVGPYMPQKSKARVFQALRIYVNDELGELQAGLDGALGMLGAHGRLCVISYHSLEDKIVKYFMKEHADPCSCPPDLPKCSCGRQPELTLVTKRAIRPSPEEIERNPRARSALLRAAEKPEMI
ncbi:16S rRNA (cytosine(1402)-N(4))-methyltransferase RsmH [Candidatus Omnitrophota bacterium]